MRRSRSQRRAGRRRERGAWALRLAWLAGGTLVCLGALAGAFGTVAWLTVLCASSLPALLLGIAALGAAPVIGGGALLWAGLAVIEKTAAKSRIRAVPDERLVEAAGTGATAPTIALRLGFTQLGDVEPRLDDLVARDALAMEITDQGEVFYKPLRQPGWPPG